MKIPLGVANLKSFCSLARSTDYLTMANAIQKNKNKLLHYFNLLLNTAFTQSAVKYILLHCKTSVTARTHRKQLLPICPTHNVMQPEAALQCAVIRCRHDALYHSAPYRIAWHCIAVQRYTLLYSSTNDVYFVHFN